MAMQRFAQPQGDPYGGQFQRSVGRPEMGIGGFMQRQVQAQPQMAVQGGPQWNAPMMAQRQQMMAQMMAQQPVQQNSNPGNLAAAVMPQMDMKRNALMDLARQGAPKLGRSQPGMMYAGGSPGMGLARPGVMRRG
jgi:hypothetical protein